MLAFAAAGCESFSDYCEAKMDCLGGNEADVEDCEIDLEYDSDKASVWGCDEYFETMVECLEERSQCDSEIDPPAYTSDDCEAELSDNASCLNDQ